MFKKQQARAAYQLCLWTLLAVTFAFLGKAGDVMKLFNDVADLFAVLAPILIAIVILGVLSLFGLKIIKGVRMIVIEESFGTLYAVFAIAVIATINSIMETFQPRSDGVRFGTSWYATIGAFLSACLIIQIYILPKCASFLLARNAPSSGTFAT